MKKRIKLKEHELNNLISEAVRRILRENDRDYFIRNCEKECSIKCWIDPSTKEIVKDGEECDGCIDFTLIPKLTSEDENGFELVDIDYDFEDDDYNNQFGDIVDQYIDDNYDELYDEIKKNASYTIY